MSLGLCKSGCINQVFHNFNMKSVKTIEEKCGYPQLNSACGKQPVLHGAVKNGAASKQGQWPFLVALKYTQNMVFFCGGNLITSRHVITGE